MRIGASLFLIALGAILRFAVTTHNTHGSEVKPPTPSAPVQ